MSYRVGFHPGTVWKRIDLQCHTPRDQGWIGHDGLPGETEEHHKARKAWAVEFVEAAKSKGLSVLSVTDHHDFTMIKYVEEVTRENRDLVFFPGMEITCSDAVQCLAIFEPSSSEQDWDRLLSKLGNVTAAARELPKAALTEQCGLTIKELFDVVSSDTRLRQCVLLIPHFGNEKAHKSLNAKGHAARSQELDCDGVYIECAFDALDTGTVDKIRGKTIQWGQRRRAILATGDNKRSDYERLGAHECWIKIGEPSIEALRQAFLADEARIAYTQPSAPTDCILRMRVKSTLTGPEPVEMSFNDGFTAFIGGRGSGKSSMLEYLRFGLGRSENDLQANNLLERGARTFREREARLIESTLKEGFVEVDLVRDGVHETWHRSVSDSNSIKIRFADDSEEKETIQEAQQRFKARAFHQKELSTTMVNVDAAAENVTAIAAAEVVEKRREIEQEVINAKRSVGTTLRELAEHWQSEFELKQIQNVVSDIRRRLESVREDLAKGGVTPEDLDVLAQTAKYGQAESFLTDIARIAERDIKQIEEIEKHFLSIDLGRYSDALKFSSLEKLSPAVLRAREEATKQFAQIKNLVSELISEQTVASNLFSDEKTSYDAALVEAKGRQAQHQALIAEAERLAAALKETTEKETIQTEKVTRTRESVDKFSTAQDKLKSLVSRRHELLKTTSEEIREKSNGSLKARPKRDPEPAEYLEAVKNLVEASRLRDVDTHCQEWIQNSVREDSIFSWEDFCVALLDLYKSKIMAGSPSEPDAEAAKRISEIYFQKQVSMTPQMINRLFSNLTDETVGAALAATPRDTIKLTYVSDGRDIDFRDASPGQQASALLRLLLRQKAGTLIIDQPEDDLDNRVLMEIVEMIRTSKSQRQLIFATHNPNLVVNGDADKVVVMNATLPEDRPGPEEARFGLECDGAIETLEVRNSITGIMEGGREAFDLRARKYGDTLSRQNA